MSSISEFEFSTNTFSKSSTQNPIATITGECFGTFTSTTGLDIDALVGLIHLKNSSIGTHTVTYSVTINENLDTTSKNVTITA